MEDMEGQLQKTLEANAKAYREVLLESFYSKQGEEEANTEELREEILKSLQESSGDERMFKLRRLMQIMSESMMPREVGLNDSISRAKKYLLWKCFELIKDFSNQLNQAA